MVVRRYTAKKKIALEWINMSDEERYSKNLPLTRVNIIRYLGIAPNTFKKWEDEFRGRDIKQIMDESLYSFDKVLEEMTEPVKSSTIQPEEVADFKRLIFEVGMSKQASAKDRELCGKMLGILVEKSQQEVIHKIDGNYLAREILRARRELEAIGMAQVPRESSLLPPDLRLPSGQEQNNHS